MSNLDATPILEKVFLVVPLRRGSTRLKEKIYQKVGSKTLMESVLERCISLTKEFPQLEVVAAVDDLKTEKLLGRLKNKIKVVQTDPELRSGTDRVFEALRSLGVMSQARGIINVQGDIPFVGLSGLRQIVSYFSEGRPDDLKRFGYATLSQEWPQELNLSDLSHVKVLVDRQRKAIYFSRFPIPYTRIKPPRKLSSTSLVIPELHIGVYGYTPEVLTRFCMAPDSAMERAESLEQLRALELGIPLQVLKCEVGKHDSFRGVDTAQDLRWAQGFARRKTSR